MWTLILSTFLYVCECGTLTAELEQMIQTLVMRCCWRLLSSSYKDNMTNEEVRSRIQNAIRVHDDLTMMNNGNSDGRSSGMAKTILHGTVKVARRRGRQKKK